MLLSVPAVFFTGASECLKRYLMAQGVVMPAAGATFCSMVGKWCVRCLHHVSSFTGVPECLL